MAGAGKVPEMGAEQARCEVVGREDVEMVVVEEPRAELGDGGGWTGQVDKRRTWRGSAMAKMGWRWSRLWDRS